MSSDGSRKQGTRARPPPAAAASPRTAGARLSPARIGARRLARECAVQVLYQVDAVLGSVDAGDRTGELLGLFWDHFAPEEGVTDEVREFAGQLVRGTAERAHSIDETIQRFSQNWRLERMARVDRNILRLAVFELLHARDVPPRVVLNEAIELGKRFGTEESGAFINGILDRVAQETEPPGAER